MSPDVGLLPRAARRRSSTCTHDNAARSIRKESAGGADTRSVTVIHTILIIWAVASLPLALLVARCIQPPTRPGQQSRQAVPADARWLDDQPLEIRLTRTEVDLRLRDIEAAESWTA